MDNREHEIENANEGLTNSVTTLPPDDSTNDRYAGFWMRFWAYITDVVIVFSINGIILSPLLLFNKGEPMTISFWTVNGILASILFYVYFVLMTRFLGQTLGKIIFGLKVIRTDHEPLKWSDLLFREVIGRFIHKVFFFCSLLYLVVAFHPKKQGIHDLFGNTNVIHVN